MQEILCENLTLGYEDGVIAKDISFEVNSGDYLCIVGENGAGKSTLMRTLLHLQKPISGRIEYHIKSTDIGYLPQQTIVQKDFPASVWEVVCSGCQARSGAKPFYSKKEKHLAAENLEKLGILDLRKKCYRDLSGGQQQRVLLARALCATEKMLLLDEPAAGLDPKVTGELYRIISDLNGEGITIIMISHDIHAALTYASHVLHMGEENFFGTLSEYKDSTVGKSFTQE